MEICGSSVWFHKEILWYHRKHRKMCPLSLVSDGTVSSLDSIFTVLVLVLRVTVLVLVTMVTVISSYLKTKAVQNN